MKQLVGYGFSLPSKPNLLNIQNLSLQQFSFVGRLKLYPTEFYDIQGGDCYHTIINPIFKTESWLFFMPNMGAMAYPKGISVGHRPYRFFRLHHFKLSTFYFDGVVRGLHPTKLYFIPIWFFGALENSTLQNFLNYQKYDNLTNFSLKLFFNVKLLTKLQGF